MSEIVGWLAFTVVAGLLFAVGSLVDWKSVLSKYVGGPGDGDGDDDRR